MPFRPQITFVELEVRGIGNHEIKLGFVAGEIGKQKVLNPDADPYRDPDLVTLSPHFLGQLLQDGEEPRIEFEYLDKDLLGQLVSAE